jgi:hypothetical protein
MSISDGLRILAAGKCVDSRQFAIYNAAHADNDEG